MAEQSSAVFEQIGWSVEGFKGFWSNPDPTFVPHILSDDIVGYWTGRAEPVRGKEAYTQCIADIVQALPGMRLEVAEHAVNGDYVFIRWIMHATGANGPFEMTGIDRVRTRGPLVCENHIVFDSATFEERSGMSIPWT